MKYYWLPLLGANALLAGCCIAPTETALVPEVEATLAPAGTEPTIDQATAQPYDDAAVGADLAPAPAVEPLPTDPAALAAAAPTPPAAPGTTATTGAADTSAAAVPVGALLAGGAQYAYEDSGIVLTLPAGWTQQLMTGGIIALFSDDYPATGVRDRGALMMISEHQDPLPTGNSDLRAVLAAGLDPAATIEAGPIRLQVAGQPAAQIIARATDADGAQYRVIHTLMQSGARNISVKAIAFDRLEARKPLFDAVMESISVTAPARA